MMKKLLCLLLVIAISFSAVSVSFAAEPEQSDPINVEISINKNQYSSVGLAKFTVTVENNSNRNMENVSAETIFDRITPCGYTSETAIIIDHLAAGEKIKFSFKATLNKDVVGLSDLQRILITIIGFLNGRVPTVDEGFNDGREYIEVSKQLSFGGVITEQKVRVRFTYEEDIESEIENLQALNDGNLPDIYVNNEGLSSFIDGKYSSNAINNVDDAVLSLNGIKNITGIENPMSEYKAELISAFSDTKYYRLQQYHDGYKVFGSQFVIATNANGDALALSGSYKPMDYLSTERNVSEDEAYRTAAADYAVENGGELVIYSLNGFLEFAWIFTGTDTVFVSAVDGSIISGSTNIITMASIGSGTNENGETVTINTTLDDNGTPGVLSDDEYTFYDSLRNIYLANLRGVSTEKLSWGDRRMLMTQNILTDSDNIWSESGTDKAITLYQNLTQVYDYYLEVLGLVSFDGNGGTILASINDGYNNAYSYGPKNGTTLFSFGRDNTYNRDLDIIGHEYTHSLQENIFDSSYSDGEIGALMEGYSDIAGELAQLYCTGSIDWKNQVRNMINPASNSNPEKYKGSNWKGLFSSSSVRAHSNSTVLSHAVYKMWMNGLDDTNVLTELLYRTWGFLTSSSDFKAYRIAMISAARIMGLTSEKIDIISRAFDEADVKPEAIDHFFTWYSDINNKVFDPFGNPIVNVEIVFKNTSNDVEGVCVTGSDGAATISLRRQQYYVYVSAVGYTSMIFTLNHEGPTNINVVLTKTVVSDDRNCFIGGQVTSATTGEILTGVTMQFRKGIDNTSGRVSFITTTDQNGRYYAENLDYGFYTIELSKTGYITEYIVVQVAATDWPDAERENAMKQNISMSTNLSADDTVRIVLTWGESPSDLDSHLKGKTSSGNDIHVYYSNKNAYERDGSVIANLDKDDTSSYGPETMTLNWKEGIEYSYYVHLYSGTGTISTSDANISIYCGATLLYKIPAPEGSGNARYWDVFSIKDGNINIINTFR